MQRAVPKARFWSTTSPVATKSSREAFLIMSVNCQWCLSIRLLRKYNISPSELSSPQYMSSHIEYFGRIFGLSTSCLTLQCYPSHWLIVLHMSEMVAHPSMLHLLISSSWLSLCRTRNIAANLDGHPDKSGANFGLMPDVVQTEMPRFCGNPHNPDTVQRPRRGKW